MNRDHDICYTSGLSFRKLNMIPKTDEIGPIVHYDYNSILPKSYEVLEHGRVRFNLFYPTAQRVVLCTFTDKFELKKQGDYWVGDLTVGTGFIGIMLTVDDIDVLSPALPIGFGGNKPINFIQVLEEDSVIIPLNCNHGSVVMDYIQSSITGRLERIYIYLPPNYHEVEDEHYPVLYLQHGHGENETTWVNQGKVNMIYDNLIAQGKAKPAVIVMCNGMPAFELENEIHVDIIETFEAFLIREVMPFVEKKYKVSADKSNRAMAGLSMGSLQTSVISLKNQDLFNYVGIFSGFVQDVLTGYTQHLSPEYLNTYSQKLKVIFRAMGAEDRFLEAFLRDDALLQSFSIAHERVIYPGYHEWKVWQHCIHDFTQMIFLDK